MKLITSNQIMMSELQRLLDSYSQYYWTVAWATSGFELCTRLQENTERIKKLIVGTHFYQTDPDFIETFYPLENVRFIENTSGIFHPKMYLFYDNNESWELLVGSANFTKSAFFSNVEIDVLIKSTDSGASQILDEAFSRINQIWEQAAIFTSEELHNYRKSWQKQRSKLKSLSNTYGSENSKKPAKVSYKIPVITMSWPLFMQRIQESPHHNIEGRLCVLETSRSYFQESQHFAQLGIDERKAIAGTFGVKNGIDWRWFGSMVGNGKFQNRIIENDMYISAALDQIPLQGNITESQYYAFVEQYQKASSGESWIATATRLLAMKRPDVFLCLDSKNKKKLCNEFEISSSSMTYERYWNDIILRIFDSEWWQSSMPTENLERKIWYTRAAFLDALYYDPE